MTMKGCDYASPVGISVADLKLQNIQFVMRYIGGRLYKQLWVNEVKELLRAGIQIGIVWEETAGAMNGGFGVGQRAARMVQSALPARGFHEPYPAIYFAVDYDWQGDVGVLSCLSGAASVIGPDLVGIYGSYRVCNAAKQHWVKKFQGHHLYLWQTLAWSGNDVIPGADLYQGDGFAWGGHPSDRQYHARISNKIVDKDTAFTKAGLYVPPGFQPPPTPEKTKTCLTDHLGGRALKVGMKGPDAKKWQHTMNERINFDKNSKWYLIEDGDFGSKTEARTKSFQFASGIPNDGVVGLNTCCKAYGC